MRSRTAEDWVFLALMVVCGLVLLAMLVLIPLAIVQVIQSSEHCHALGGVLVRGLCIDKSVVLR